LSIGAANGKRPRLGVRVAPACVGTTRANDEWQEDTMRTRAALNTFALAVITAACGCGSPAEESSELAGTPTEAVTTPGEEGNAITADDPAAKEGNDEVGQAQSGQWGGFGWRGGFGWAGRGWGGFGWARPGWVGWGGGWVRPGWMGWGGFGWGGWGGRRFFW
jgi:hypothetical protein